MEKREWKTIKEYQDILFDFYNGIAKITISKNHYQPSAIQKRIHSYHYIRNQRRTAYLP